MSTLLEKRKQEFIETIKKERRLPRMWEYEFTDGEDMRLWFTKLYIIDSAKPFIEEINELLSKYNQKLLTDKDKEKEFLKCVETIYRIPLKDEFYFSDNSDMYVWYINYKKKNQAFETRVYTNLPEYTDFDLVTIWPLIKKEFIKILQKIKRIPNFGEITLQNEIDVRVVCEKLKSYDPKFFEEILLHLETYNKKSLSELDRITQLEKTVLNLGYIPDLQEVRFSDGTDMFTWYMRKKDEIADLEQKITSLITEEKPNKTVNIYLIPEFKSKGGRFYTMCTNVGEKLDLTDIISFEEAQKLDPTIAKRGGLILKKDEEIGSVSFGKGKKK